MNPIFIPIWIFIVFNLVGVAITLKQRFGSFEHARAENLKTRSFPVWIARLCCVFDGVCFLGMVAFIFIGVLEGTSENDNLMVMFSIVMFGLIGLVPYIASMTLLWSWIRGTRLKAVVRAMLFGLVLYVAVLASVYEILIGIAL